MHRTKSDITCCEITCIGITCSLTCTEAACDVGYVHTTRDNPADIKGGRIDVQPDTVSCIIIGYIMIPHHQLQQQPQQPAAAAF